MHNRPCLLMAFVVLLGPLPVCAQDLVAIPSISRIPVLDRPRVFPLNGVKYNLYLNYLHEWIDRPLLFDRSLRDDQKAETLNYPSFSICLKTGLSYGLDGFAVLVGTPGMLQRYLDAADHCDRFKPDGFSILPEFGTGGYNKSNLDGIVGYQARALEKAMASPTSFRIGGKVVVCSYSSDRILPEEWERILARHHETFGDRFLFVLDARLGVHEIQESFHQHGGKIERKLLDAFKTRLRTYLDVCDGIMFGGPNHLAVLPDRKLDAEFYRDGLAPLYTAVVSEPKYRGKLLGLGAALGYVNYRSGSMQHEDGTRHLRQSMEIAVAARPDIIVMPEWGEFNENTCVMPTVANSFSTQRIMRFYMDRMQGKPPSPKAGDDPSVPNLVLSYRRILKLGEPLEIELLNVPGGSRGTYTARLALKGPDGEPVHSFPETTLAADRLDEKWLVLPSEKLSKFSLLRPSLTVTHAQGKSMVFEDGLQHIVLRPSWNWDYKWVKQPLRDVLRPAIAEFRLSGSSPGRVAFEGKVDCGEEINTVEVLQDGDEVYAVDRLDEYPSRDTHVLLKVAYMSMREQPIKGKLTVRGARFRMYPPNIYHGRLKGQVFSLDYKANTSRRGFIFAVPREDAVQGSLEFDFNLVRETVPMARIVKDGAWACSSKDGFHLTVEDYQKLPDIPVPLDKRSVSFAGKCQTELARSIFHMRVVTKSGKLYRSRPIVAGDGKGLIELNVYSTSRRQTVTVPAQRADIPDITYLFTPRHGALLVTAAGARWRGELGGGSESDGPFNRSEGAYPKDSHDAAPDWVTEDGATCLKFDGKGNYVSFPLETVPSGAFTLAMDIKPTVDKEQVLLDCHSTYVGPLHVRRMKG